MIDFNVEFKGKGAVLKALAQIKSGVERKKVLSLLADEAVELIKTRTRDGRDENDRALIPSKRAQRDNGQTLADEGHMLGAMRVLSVGPDRATIGFGDQIQAKKAWWAQDGTEPHDIFAKPGHALAFKNFGYQNAFRVASKKMGARVFSMKNYSASAAMKSRKGVTGMTVLSHVRHPGTPKRPFFGVSPKDSVHLQAIADAHLKGVVAEAQR